MVLVWEGLLAIVTVAMLVVALTTAPGRHLVNVLSLAGPLGLMATGMALSFRTGTPNLAVGSIAAFTGALTAVILVEQGQGIVAAAVALLVAALAGVLLGLFTAAVSAPSWAVTLGAATAVEMLTLALTDTRVVPAPFFGDVPGWLWFVLFALISIVGALVLPSLKLGSPLLGAVVGLGGSSLLAGLGGLALLARVQAATPGSGFTNTVIVLAAVLLGGVSVHGRRGGVTGVVLAVLLLALVQAQFALWALPFWVFSLIAALVVLGGLLAGRLAELVSPEDAPPQQPPRQPPGPPLQPPPPPAPF
ncbi:ABC transporter permease subunit, partial [Nonomuraea rhizosphaerae]|uniref:ABC transporter permease subunit n=1 Tax=Nonomuraea rhizosphaerae TaxID=2665663 RepID=UPI001C5EA975